MLPLPFPPPFDQHQPMRFLRDILAREDGATAVEYAVMLALIIATCLIAIGSMGSSTKQMWQNNNTQLNNNW